MHNSMFGKSTSPSPGMSQKLMAHQLGDLNHQLNQQSFASNGMQLFQRRGGNRPTSVTPPTQRQHQTRNDFGVSFVTKFP